MDEWYDIGAHIKCKTCLGQEISGILVAYDIDQKLMFLKRTNTSPTATKPNGHQTTENPQTSDHPTLQNSTTNTSSQMSQSTTSLLPASSSFVSSSPNAKPYVLLNLRFISEITEVEDEESTRDASLVNAFIESENNNSVKEKNSEEKNSESSKEDKNNSTNTDAKAGGDFSMDNLDKKQQDVINSVNPSSKLDMDKLEERLTNNREKKFEEAKLADIGVTRDGLDLYQVFKKTLDVRWKESSLIILDDVKISPPYNESSCEKLNVETKDQTLEQVKKRLEKFYTERDQQEIAAAFWKGGEKEEKKEGKKKKKRRKIICMTDFNDKFHKNSTKNLFRIYEENIYLCMN